MEELKKYKNKDIIMYRKLNSEFRSKASKAKTKYMEEICEKIIGYQKQARLDFVFLATENEMDKEQETKRDRKKDQIGNSRHGLQENSQCVGEVHRRTH